MQIRLIRECFALNLATQSQFIGESEEGRAFANEILVESLEIMVQMLYPYISTFHNKLSINKNYMPETNPNLISENFAITVTLENNGYYLCQLSNPLPDPSQNNINCYGQTQEHAIAIALEQLAEKYRQIAEEAQNVDMLAVERSADGEAINKLYHVTLNFECIIDAESKFEAMHNTIMGNTVVENGKITVIEVGEDLPVADILKLGDWQ